MTFINKWIVPFVTIIQFAALKGYYKGNQLCVAPSCFRFDGSVILSYLIDF